MDSQDRAVNAWTQQLSSLSRCAAERDKYSGLPTQKRLAQEKLDMVERVIAEGHQKAAMIAHETGISFGSINSYLRVLEQAGRIKATSGRNRIKTYEVTNGN
jgi:hypothetical protein